MESIFGKMAESTMDNGQIMIWKVSESTSGVMGEDMRASIIMIRNQDMEYTSGQMEENMRAGGSKASSMV